MRFASRLGFSCLLIFSLPIVSSSVFAGDSVWTGSGPLGGGVFELAFDPVNPQIAYATTRGSVFKTTNAGASWQRASNGIVASSVYPLPLAMDRESPTTLFTFDSSQRLYRSDDGAATWQILRTNLDANFIFSVFSDVAGANGALFVGGFSQTPTGLPQLFKSDSGTENFVRIGAGLPPDARIATITVDPANPAIVFVGLENAGAVNRASLFKSTDGGLNFSPALNLFGSLGYQPGVQDLSFISGTGGSPTGSLFAVINDQIYHSADGGANWTGPHGPASVITAHPTDPLKSYFGRADGAFVWFAPNPSPSFNPYNEGLTPNLSYVSIPGGIPIRAAVSRLVPQPGYPAVGRSLYATTESSGVYARAEGAPSWNATVQNPSGVAVRALAIHPHSIFNNPNGSPGLLAGHSGSSVSSPGLYRSDDQGLNWIPYNNGLRAKDLRALKIDPTTLGGSIANTVMYAGGANAGVDASYQGAGIYRSINNGTNWLSMDGNLPVDVTNHANIGLIRSLSLDPRSCPTPPVVGPCSSGGLQRLYALAEGRAVPTVFRSNRGPVNGFNFTHRIVRTNDFGVSWEALDDFASELPGSFTNDLISQKITPTRLLVDPNNSDVIYLGTEAIYDDFNNSDAVVPDDLASGVFKSTDGGNQWNHLGSNGLPTKTGFTTTQLDVMALLIDPNDSNVLWVALTDLRSTGFSTIYRSNNGGATWTRFDEGINASVELRDLVFDPQNSNILYAAAGGYDANPGAVYRGVWNPGTQSIVWLSISVGLPAESAYTIAVDPFNPDVIHAGTDLGVVSIKRLPDQDNDGIPDARENQAPDVPGGLAGLGDGNGDGQFDAAQRDVGSIGVVKRAAKGTAPAVFTTDLIGGAGAEGCSGGTAQAVDVQMIDPDALGLDPVPGLELFYQHGIGINGFEVLGCTSAIMRIRYHGRTFNTRNWSFRVFGPQLAGNQDTMGWNDFSAFASLVAPDTWQINLRGNEFGSYRPEVDAIRFVGGPACLEDALFADGMEDTPIQIPLCP